MMIDVMRNVPGIGICKCLVEEPVIKEDDPYRRESGSHPMDAPSLMGEVRRLPRKNQLPILMCRTMQNWEAAGLLLDDAIGKKIRWGVRYPIKRVPLRHRNSDACDCKTCKGSRGYSVFWDDRGQFWDDPPLGGWQPGDVKESMKWYVRKDGSIRREIIRETVGSDSPPSVTPVV